MIKCKSTNSDGLKIVEVKGHAGFAQYGNDIVCAAVSTALIMTANLVELMDLQKFVTTLICEAGFFQLAYRDDNRELSLIVKNLEYTLEQLAEEYPKNIKYNR